MTLDNACMLLFVTAMIGVVYLLEIQYTRQIEALARLVDGTLEELHK